MGFPPAKAKKVIQESKLTALNDLIDLILKDLTSDVEMQANNALQSTKNSKEYN
jgi:hypothetical protein